MNLKHKYLLIILLFCFILLIFLLFNINNLSKIYFGSNRFDEQVDTLYCYAYDNTTSTPLLLVTVTNSNGIESILFPNGSFVIDGKGKNKVSFDYQIDLTIDNTFTITDSSGQQIQYTITDENIQNSIVLTSSEINSPVVGLNCSFSNPGYSNLYYKIGESGNWTEFTSDSVDISVDDFVKYDGYDKDSRITTIYVKGTDSVGHICTLKKQVPLKVITVPNAVVLAASSSSDSSTNQFLKDISDKLAENYIATSLMDLDSGETSSIESNSANAETIFNSWGRIGMTGQWSYSNGIITNAENTGNYTGFYYPNKSYQEITFSYNNRTTDADDDIMGCMFKFNKNSDGTVTTYLFALDKHDNGGGIGNGAFNGLLKIKNNSFSHSSVQKLSVNPSLVWTRNTWTNYKIVTTEDNIKVYINNVLKLDYTDPDPIKTGSYGFFSYSQAYSQYKDIVASGYTPYTLEDIVNGSSFVSVNNNVIIHISNESEPLLQDDNFLNLLSSQNIHYIGIGSSSNQAEIEQFIAANNNNGMFADSSDYDNAISQVANYIMNICITQ